MVVEIPFCLSNENAVESFWTKNTNFYSLIDLLLTINLALQLIGTPRKPKVSST